MKGEHLLGSWREGLGRGLAAVGGVQGPKHSTGPPTSLWTASGVPAVQSAQWASPPTPSYTGH